MSYLNQGFNGNPYAPNPTPAVNIGVQAQPQQQQTQQGISQQEAQFIQGFYQSQFGIEANQYMQQKMSEYMQSLQPQPQVVDTGKSQDSDISEMKEMLNSMLLLQERNDSRLSRLEQDLGASNAEESEIN